MVLNMNTKKWAVFHRICVEDVAPPVEGCDAVYNRTAEEIAIRTIVLQCVVAVGYEVEPRSVVDWLKNKNLWSHVSPNEKMFLLADKRSSNECSDARWREEAQWALLWSIRKIETLGLPTTKCDTARLVDEIMPALGDSVASFVSSSHLRSQPELVAEDLRTYNLHCFARQAYRKDMMPDDLIYGVLYQRHYAFEWLNSDFEWDAVTTDT